jgi:hypothetical protein
MYLLWKRKRNSQCSLRPKESTDGLGIEQNVVTLCPKCHEDFDNGFLREKIGNYIREYLKSIYGATWCESELVYDKWTGFKFNK